MSGGLPQGCSSVASAVLAGVSVLGADVAGQASDSVALLVALVAAVDRSGLAVGGVARADRAAAQPQRERLRRAAVASERANIDWIAADLA